MIRFLLAKIRNTWTSSGPMSHSSLVFSTSLVFQCWTFQTTSTKNNWHGNWEHQDGRGSQEKGFLSFPSKVKRFLTFDICQTWESPIWCSGPLRGSNQQVHKPLHQAIHHPQVGLQKEIRDIYDAPRDGKKVEDLPVSSKSEEIPMTFVLRVVLARMGEVWIRPQHLLGCDVCPCANLCRFPGFSEVSLILVFFRLSSRINSTSHKN